ncbi:protoporphyrinogen oxidase [Alicyclobacillus vulcanalis]|uniref:Coproporphyrinogen III oxidase n=1 Tax=Alicyclobacillus vulcanalis TaxID=252246 RepID=A0A1N7P8J2_9BACL|nr:protoporphyrinogen oxidase [Alicyclobacillus vulcanalis]SIT06914.1 oxygen-dependent protoporphyrinogen oxidase [Alicyclobacillus vulcanalis]
MRRVAVVGGGITGLAASLRLLASGEEVNISLYEASDRLGGRVQTLRIPELGVTVEAGPDSMLARKPAALRLIEELGMGDEVVSTRPEATKTYIVRGSELCPLPKGYLGIPHDPSCVHPPLLSEVGLRRALEEERLPFDVPEGDMALGAFLRARLGEEWVRFIGEPLLAGIYAGDVERLSLYATWPSLVDLARQHGSLVAASRALARSTRQAPQASGRSAFVTVQGGLASLTDRMEARIRESGRAEIHTRSRVTALTRRGHTYEVHVETDAGERFEERVDGVILAVPPHVARDALRSLVAMPAVDTFYQSTATVVMVYPRDAFGAELEEASGFLVPRPEGLTITATTWMSSKWPHVAPDSLAVIRAYVGRRGQDDALLLPDDVIAARAADEVGRLTGARGKPLWVRVTRFSEAMPNYGVGHLARVDEAEAALRTACPAVAVAGAGWLGVGLPDCVEQGERAAMRVLAALHA